MPLIIEHRGKRPRIADVFATPNATILGDVTISAGASIWFDAVIRADVGHIEIGPAPISRTTWSSTSTRATTRRSVPT
ncbi:MAG: hypothetical protein R2851_26160 [Caldilineaceae bacterium]